MKIALVIFFISVVVAIVVSLMIPSLTKGKWYRGALHCHSYWSDGESLPELIVGEYKDNGFHFVCLSDHDALQEDNQRWKLIDDQVRQRISDMRERFGVASIETRTRVDAEGKTIEEVRLKNWKELAQIFDKSGEFLMMPGHEINKRLHGSHIHSNALNVLTTQPFIEKDSVAAVIQAHIEGLRGKAIESGQPNILMANHPSWHFFDLDPVMLAGIRDLQLYELINYSGTPAERNYPEVEARMWKSEEFFDLVTTLRLTKGWPPIYGTLTDDAHNYDKPRTSPGKHYPLRGWVMVRSKSLAAPALIAALAKGDFYGSSGVVLDELDFDGKKLKIKVRPEPSVTYSIRFHGSPRGIASACKEKEVIHFGGKMYRTIWDIDPQVGQVLATVEGTEASYTLQDNDLYVRATITTSRLMQPAMEYHPPFESAFTQPYFQNIPKH